jgi:hypothetical protein
VALLPRCENGKNSFELYICIYIYLVDSISRIKRISGYMYGIMYEWMVYQKYNKVVINMNCYDEIE